MQRDLLLTTLEGNQQLFQFRSAVLKCDPILMATISIQFFQGKWSVSDKWTAGGMDKLSSFRLEECRVDPFASAVLLFSAVARPDVLLKFLGKIGYQLRARNGMAQITLFVEQG